MKKFWLLKEETILVDIAMIDAVDGSLWFGQRFRKK